MVEAPLRILIVDDSRIFRGALESALAQFPDVRVVGSVWSGEKAVEFVRQSPPDLVTMDVNMPGCGGLNALSAIQQLNASRPNQPGVGVILISALTKQGAEVTVEGLQRGAFDFIAKPAGNDPHKNQAELERQLAEKIDLFAQKRRYRLRPRPVPSTPSRKEIACASGRYQAVAIGSSTGGPEALARLLPRITTRGVAPIFIVQHLPEGMTAYFAASLAKISSYRVIEATDGQLVMPRTVYVAPGGKHLLVRRQQQETYTVVNDQPPENFCRPSVDVLFRSVAIAYAGTAVAVVLTGMGHDGAAGLGALKRSGAYILAQDEATSVVFGMPRAAIATNCVDEILPLDEIAPAITRLLGTG